MRQSFVAKEDLRRLPAFWEKTGLFPLSFLIVQYRCACNAGDSRIEGLDQRPKRQKQAGDLMVFDRLPLSRSAEPKVSQKHMADADYPQVLILLGVSWGRS